MQPISSAFRAANSLESQTYQLFHDMFTRVTVKTVRVQMIPVKAQLWNKGVYVERKKTILNGDSGDVL